MQHKSSRRGFTLMELMVVIIIIAILAAVAVPQYKKAALKSRFSTVMPMAKSISDANEVYYQGRQMYALSTEELDVAPVTAENTSVALSTADEEDKFNYVVAQRSDVPGNRYIMYQKHSANFPGNIHCEALTGDTQAEQLCQALGGENIGENGSYTAYLLSGNSAGGTFDKECKTTPETEQACSDGCGTATREAQCDTRTGEWSYGEWSECPVKPAASQECSANNKSGTQTRSVTCNNGAWTTGSWSSCNIPCTGSKPANKTAGLSGATGTASCVEGEWVYNHWTGGGSVTLQNNSCGNSYSPAYDCAGERYTGIKTFCRGESSKNYVCMGGTFSGYGSYCAGRSAGYCSYSYISGSFAHCDGRAANACKGSTISPWANCRAYAEGGCDGVKYNKMTDSNGDTISGCCYSTNGYCPVGSPKCKSEGNNPTYNVFQLSWNGKCWGEGGTEIDCED